jgi:hypothetical protein
MSRLLRRRRRQAWRVWSENWDRRWVSMVEMREGSYIHGLKLPILGHFAKRKRDRPPKCERVMCALAPRPAQDLNHPFGQRWQKQQSRGGDRLVGWGWAFGESTSQKCPIFWSLQGRGSSSKSAHAGARGWISRCSSFFRPGAFSIASVSLLLTPLPFVGERSGLAFAVQFGISLSWHSRWRRASGNWKRMGLFVIPDEPQGGNCR